MLPKLIRPRRFGDARGWFTESYNAERFSELGINDVFLQDNHSFSAARGTLRGLHLQRPPHAQAKLIRCIAGEIFDVSVDCRSGSPTRGRWVGAVLNPSEGQQLYIPTGFAHGFLTLAQSTEVLYKASSFYAPSSERSVAWDDPDLAIAWPLNGDQPILSDKDSVAGAFRDLDAEFPFEGDPLGELEEVIL